MTDRYHRHLPPANLMGIYERSVYTGTRCRKGHLSPFDTGTGACCACVLRIKQVDGIYKTASGWQAWVTRNGTPRLIGTYSTEESAHFAQAANWTDEPHILPFEIADKVAELPGYGDPKIIRKRK